MTDLRDPPSSQRHPIDGDDGVRITRHATPRGVRVAAIVVVLALVAFVGDRWLTSRGSVSRSVAMGDGAVTDHGVPAPASGAATMHAKGVRGRAMASSSASPDTINAPRDGEDPTPDLADYVLPGDAPSMAQVIDALHARGIRTGLGAFPKPGTSPPLAGLEVPDDFPLPPGYVRHHQATDDGQRIAPILMFSPDVQFVDGPRGRVPVPTDRVVPPDLAPAGMPLRRVVIPSPRDPGSV